MSTSRNTGRRADNRTPLRDGLPDPSRYDVVLAAIPSVFLVALLVHLVAPVSLQVAVAAGAACSALLLADALYVNPPSIPGRSRGR